jgi:hypothetical protein
MSMQQTEPRLSSESIAHLRKVAAEIVAFFEAGGSGSERPSLDAAWAVLEAAIDFDDGTTVEAARRVIDASLNGTAIDESDLIAVENYFK